MNTLFRIAKKEFGAFFSSLVGIIFLGVFLAVTLFVFFWVETFFARNITEVRPLFQWMPILLIFLTAAITMRMWAEEHRAGTLELLLTSPVQPAVLVFGKFLACLALIVVALVLTLPLPVTVSMLGPLDWGPVLGGYLATLFLSAAYVSIGLFVSAKSENQIVSLITTTLICSFLYLLGSDTLVAFLGNRAAELLQLLGTGSRFDSITRGVVDLRDLYYYISIMGVFLCLNIYGLEKIRWAGNRANSSHRKWQLAVGLLIANCVIANFWLAPLSTIRTDMTKGNIYSISDSTRSLLQQVKEPLLIRGYFSPQTHPLLAPLVPRLRDLLKEYSAAGGSKVRVEFVDPLENPEIEHEAGQKYGIRPVPFQTTSKYQASVTNSYFDILISYGDQFEKLGFRDLIEIKSQNEQDLDVELRNPEYDITRAIKKVLYSYQGGGDIFRNINKPVAFTGYFSADNRLPNELVALKNAINAVVDEMQNESDGLFSNRIVDPEADNGEIAKKISAEYGFRPMSASLFDNNTFWFYMTLASGDQVLEIPLPENLDTESVKRSIDAGLKRFATGFTKTVALSVPENAPAMPQYGMMAPQGPQFNALREILSQEHVVTEADLEQGRVPAETDLLLVVAPENLDDKQLLAIDQFLMQGGTVVVSTSPHKVNMQGALSLEKNSSGLEGWLAHNGVTIGDEVVLDTHNSPFPIPVQRTVRGFSIQETRLVKYPFFIDIRSDGMDADSGMMSGMNQLTMNWASPIEVDAGKSSGRTVTRLLESSSESWLSAETNIQPDFRKYGDLGFPVEQEQGKQLLAVAIEGSFTSYFTGKPSPLADDGTAGETGKETTKEDKQVIIRQIDKSPESSRLILFASNSFLRDAILSISSGVRRSSSLEPVQMIENTVDWSLEDRGLLAIRGRSHFSRPLIPLTRDQQMFWEYLNYGAMLAGLFLVWVIKGFVNKRSEQRRMAILQQPAGRI